MTKDFKQGVNAGIAIVRDYIQMNSLEFCNKDFLKMKDFFNTIDQKEFDKNWLLKEYAKRV